MDSELTKLVQNAVSDGITSASWIMILVSVVAAAIGAYVGAYLKIKAEHVATKEDFAQLLSQLEEQTRITENIKADIQRDINTFNSTLERDREFAGFRRERIVEHLDIVLNAYVELSSIAQLVPLRLWLASNSDLETGDRFYIALSKLRTHFGALDFLGVIPNATLEEFNVSDSHIAGSWTDVLSEAAYRTPEYQKEFPNGTAFSGDRYFKKCMDFMSTVDGLGRVIKRLSHDIVLPI